MNNNRKVQSIQSNMKSVLPAVTSAVVVILLAVAGCSKKASQETLVPPHSVPTLPAPQPLPALLLPVPTNYYGGQFNGSNSGASLDSLYDGNLGLLWDCRVCFRRRLNRPTISRSERALGRNGPHRGHAGRNSAYPRSG